VRKVLELRCEGGGAPGASDPLSSLHRSDPGMNQNRRAHSAKSQALKKYLQQSRHLQRPFFVIPVETGIQSPQEKELDSCFRRNDTIGSKQSKEALFLECYQFPEFEGSNRIVLVI
jgi:hypothetical protein